MRRRPLRISTVAKVRKGIAKTAQRAQWRNDADETAPLFTFPEKRGIANSFLAIISRERR